MVQLAYLGLTAAVAGMVAANPVEKRDLNLVAGSPDSIKNLKEKIKNVVLIVMENRSVDNLLGGQQLHNLDNPINKGPFCNPRNLTDPSQGKVCAEAKDYDSILDDPDHSVHGNNLEFYGSFAPDNRAISNGSLTPNQQGFVHEQLRVHGAKADPAVLAKQVMNYYTEDQVPVITAMSHNFVTFNNWHSGVPGPTNPNRASILSGTSWGHGTNDKGFSNHELPQRSIFQQLSETNRTWAGYTAGNSDAQYFTWTISSGKNNANYIKPFESFFQDAYLGRLPDFTFINPTCCGVGTTSMHPSGLISDGEVVLKQIYDALRNGPQWNETLFIVTFDETGGFHDHVPPPLAPRPDNMTYTETTPDGSTYTLNFDRLGGRVPTWIISPWVRRGHVETLGTNSEGKQVSYSATSILRTLGYLWDFVPFNPRVAASPSFDHLIEMETMRSTLDVMPNPFTF